MPNSFRFTSFRCLSASRSSSLPHADQLVAFTPALDGGKAQDWLKDRYCPFRAIESRSHLPMSAALFLVSDRAQRNVRAPFQDTQRNRAGNLDLTFGKDLRRERDFHATQILYRRNGNTLMSRQESNGSAG
ncbi:MAG: hypothetical protein KIT76_03605 [Pseudolabrys sp.]|nr:hypothetical protein [Pseudolabrys sp.]